MANIFEKLADALNLDPFKTTDAQRSQQEAAREVKDMYGNIQLPNIDSAVLEEYGAFDPKLAEQYAPEIADTSLSSYEKDPRLEEAQLASLGALDDIIAGGGLTAADNANLNKLRSETSAADRGRREAIQMDAAQRGMASGRQAMLGQLKSAQDATMRENQAGLDIAGMAQDRALEALANRGAMATQMSGQNFDEASRVAQAQDAIRKFNASNSMVGRQMAQNMGNANTDIRNTNKQAPAATAQQNFNNQMTVTGAKAGAVQNAANTAANIESDKDKKKSAFGQGLIKLGTTAAGML